MYVLPLGAGASAFEQQWLGGGAAAEAALQKVTSLRQCRANAAHAQRRRTISLTRETLEVCWVLKCRGCSGVEAAAAIVLRRLLSEVMQGCVEGGTRNGGLNELPVFCFAQPCFGGRVAAALKRPLCNNSRAVSPLRRLAVPLPFFCASSRVSHERSRVRTLHPGRRPGQLHSTFYFALHQRQHNEFREQQSAGRIDER
jgi:hypothetical protein